MKYLPCYNQNKLVLACSLALLIGFLGCEPAARSRKKVERYTFFNGDTVYRWRPYADTTHWRQLVFAKRRQLIGLQRGKNDTFYGQQIYYFYTPEKPLSVPAMIGTERKSQISGRWRGFYPSGRPRIVADKQGALWSGRYCEFYDKNGYAPGVYKEYVVYKGKSFDNGELVFHPVTTKPVLAQSHWLPRVVLEADTITLGDSLRVRAAIRFPSSEYPYLIARLDSGQVAAKDFYTSKGQKIGFSVKPLRRGRQHLTGELFPVQLKSGVFGKGDFETEHEVVLRFDMPYVVE